MQTPIDAAPPARQATEDESETDLGIVGDLQNNQEATRFKELTNVPHRCLKVLSRVKNQWLDNQVVRMFDV